MNKTRLIMVGGFLGAGKTTLLFEATQRLMKNGQRIGLITNDQAPELVDTAFLSHTLVNVAEVSGSCFCCNYNGFISALEQVKSEARADMIIAEPVGSCTDLSATMIQPIKEHMKTQVQLAPLSVLADPSKLADILEGGNAGLHPSAAYILRKQLEEADLILITKSDLLTAEQSDLLQEKTKLFFPESQVMLISSKTGQGIDQWLAKVIESNYSGQRIVEVDYDRYAEGEAVLGWLNKTVLLQGEQINWDQFAHDFLSALALQIDLQKLGVGHIKIMLESGPDYLVGNLTGGSDTLSIRGKAGVSDEAQVIINARVGTDPQSLEQLINQILESTANSSVTLKTKATRCLSPGYPKPTYRYAKIV